MAQWCLVTGQTPAVYAGLNRLERAAFYDMAYELGIIKRKG